MREGGNEEGREGKMHTQHVDTDIFDKRKYSHTSVSTHTRKYTPSISHIAGKCEYRSRWQKEMGLTNMGSHVCA